MSENSYLKFIFSHALAFFIFSLIFWLLISTRADDHPLTAAHVKYVENRLTNVAIDEPLAKSGASLNFVLFDDRFCVLAAANESKSINDFASSVSRVTSCPRNSIVERRRILEVLEAANKNPYKTVFIDIQFETSDCDAVTLQISKLILEMSKSSLVVLPIALERKGESFEVKKNIFQMCYSEFSNVEKEAVNLSSNIVFGHPLISSALNNNNYSSIRPIITGLAETEGLTPNGNPDFQIRTFVSIPILLAYVRQKQHIKSAEETFDHSFFSDLGISTKAFPDAFIEPATVIEACGILEVKNCEKVSLSENSDVFFALPLRENSKDERNLEIKTYSADQFTIYQRDEKIITHLEVQSLLVVAGSSKNYGDLIYTPAGEMPGGKVLLNATVSFSNGVLFYFDDKSLWSSMFETTLKTLLCVIILHILLHVLAMKKFELLSSDKRWSLTWSVCIILVNVFFVFLALESSAKSIEVNTIYFHFASILAGMLEVIIGLQLLLHFLTNYIFRNLKKISFKINEAS